MSQLNLFLENLRLQMLAVFEQLPPNALQRLQQMLQQQHHPIVPSTRFPGGSSIFPPVLAPMTPNSLGVWNGVANGMPMPPFGGWNGAANRMPMPPFGGWNGAANGMPMPPFGGWNGAANGMFPPNPSDGGGIDQTPWRSPFILIPPLAVVQQMPAAMEHKKYQCSRCVYTTNLKHDMIVHVRTHTGIKPYKCLPCNLEWAKRYRHTLHMRQVHGCFAANGRHARLYVCEKCGFSAAHRNNLRLHRCPTVL